MVEIATRLREADDRRLANVAVSGMVAALVNADALEEAQAVLNAYAAREAVEPEPQPEPEQPQEGRGDRELDAYRLKVLEVRDTDRGGVRAWCKTGFNGHTAVYAKGPEAEILRRSVGNLVDVEGRKLDKGIYAVKVRAVS
ncbi:MAG: hypothetical protein ACUVSP_10090 [Desulfotomaculales bacterium]